MKVLIAAGGTAGHVVPALAVADTLRADGVDVEFAGGERAEAQLVPAAGYRLHHIPAAGLSRSNPLRAARAALKAVRGLWTALALLRRLRPDVVMGAGGYVAGPVGLAAVPAARAARADRGRFAHRDRQPRAGAVRAARVPGVPDRGAHRLALPRDRAARCRRR